MQKMLPNMTEMNGRGIMFTFRRDYRKFWLILHGSNDFPQLSYIIFNKIWSFFKQIQSSAA